MAILNSWQGKLLEVYIIILRGLLVLTFFFSGAEDQTEVSINENLAILTTTISTKLGINKKK